MWTRIYDSVNWSSKKSFISRNLDFHLFTVCPMGELGYHSCAYCVFSAMKQTWSAACMKMDQNDAEAQRSVFPTPRGNWSLHSYMYLFCAIYIWSPVDKRKCQWYRIPHKLTGNLMINIWCIVSKTITEVFSNLEVELLWFLYTYLKTFCDQILFMF